MQHDDALTYTISKNIRPSCPTIASGLAIFRLDMFNWRRVSRVTVPFESSRRNRIRNRPCVLAAKTTFLRVPLIRFMRIRNGGEKSKMAPRTAPRVMAFALDLLPWIIRISLRFEIWCFVLDN